MRATRIELRNWKRYRGEHVLDLADGVHAVCARLEDDETRSNWLGKTSLLVALGRFALYGTSGERLEDDWITRGEKAGHVRLVCDDGTRIERSRKRGQSTQLRLDEPDGKVRKQKQAQARIVELVGLSEADFAATCQVEQKQLARFILARPADRMEVVSGWLGLEPVQKCEESVRQKLSQLTVRDQQLRNRLDVAIETHRSAAAAFFPDEEVQGDVVKLAEARVEELRTEAEVAEGAHRSAQIFLAKAAEVAGLVDQADRFEAVVAEGKALKAEVIAANPRSLEAEASKLAGVVSERKIALAAAVADYQKALAVKAGEFDGQCPVVCVECPAAEFVRDEAAKSDEVVSRAEKAVEKATRAAEKARESHGEVADRLGAIRAKNTRLGQLRQAAVELKPAWKRVQADEARPDEEVALIAEEAAAEYNDAQVALQVAEERLDRLSRAAGEMSAMSQKREALAAEMETAREAVAVFGRNGAQRRIAERALTTIEADANALLSECGIDLSVKIVWAREAATGLATSCDSCGAAFPSSQRVKECACGAKRGPKLTEKLDVEMSDRSGAAEDLAGMAFHLAAAAWLRRERGAAWSVALIDEPFGSLDEANRTALSTHLARMLRSRYGFEQAFVVSHDRETTDALPGRIIIEADAEGSRFA